MKKSYVLPLSVLLLVLTLAFLVGSLMEHHTGRWQEQLRQADALAQADNWPEATALLVDSYQDWCGHQTWLHILSQHNIVDSAETMYCRCIAFAAARESSEFRAELANLSAQLELLAETEHLSLRNIL